MWCCINLEHFEGQLGSEHNIFSFYFSPLGLFFSIHPKSEIPKVRVNLSGFD